MAVFAVLGLAIHAGLFVWSDRVLRTSRAQNPFLAITQAPAQVDRVILGASHAMPLGMADMPSQIAARTGQRTLVLAAPGAGPFVLRLVAERWFADHRAGGVVIVLDAFGFADRRWNAARMADAAMLAKIPADARMARVLGRAIGRGLAWQAWLVQVTGFARINDRARFAPPDWPPAGRFTLAFRPSAAAIRARVGFLHPGAADPAMLVQGLADLEAIVRLARRKGAEVVILWPPLPEEFRAALPEVPGLAAGIDGLSRRLGVPVIDHSAAIPDPRRYFDTDHLNRDGVVSWLESGLAGVIVGAGTAGRDDGGQ